MCNPECDPSAKETPCVSGVVMSVPACVLPGTLCVYEARVSERPCVVRVTACVRSLYTREMSVAMREHAAASPGVSMNGNLVECSLGVVTRRSVWREWRPTATMAGQMPGSGCSCNRDRPGSARQRTGGPCCATGETPACPAAKVRPGPETHAVM